MKRISVENQQEGQNHMNFLNRKLKTMQSIGTHNEASSSFDHSMLSKKDIFINGPFTPKDQEKEMDLSQITKVSRQQIEANKLSVVESEVDDISRMKMLFESRINNNKQQNKNHNKSMDRSPNTKSIEKHILKPTNTPNFNKIQSKNLSFSITYLNKVQNSNTKLSNQLNEENHLNRQKCSQLNQGSQKKNVFDVSQASLKFIENQKQKSSSKIYCKTSNEMEINTTPKRIDFSQSQPKPKINQNLLQSSKFQSSVSVQKCSCENLLKDFIQQTNNKMAEITERLMHLQNQNARLRMLQHKFNENSKIIQQFKYQTQNLQNQCYALKESNYTQQAEKEELQSLLKELLFKREKQKLQKSSYSSKENTQRYDIDEKSSYKNQKTEPKNLSSNFKRQKTEQDFNDQLFYNKSNEVIIKKDLNLSKKGIQPLSTKTTNFDQPQSQSRSENRIQKYPDSKMKVQNLLNKLQIKIEKS